MLQSMPDWWILSGMWCRHGSATVWCVMWWSDDTSPIRVQQKCLTTVWTLHLRFPACHCYWCARRGVTAVDRVAMLFARGSASMRLSAWMDLNGMEKEMFPIPFLFDSRNPVTLPQWPWWQPSAELKASPNLGDRKAPPRGGLALLAWWMCISITSAGYACVLKAQHKPTFRRGFSQGALSWNRWTCKPQGSGGLPVLQHAWPSRDIDNRSFSGTMCSSLLDLLD